MSPSQDVAQPSPDDWDVGDATVINLDTRRFGTSPVTKPKTGDYLTKVEFAAEYLSKDQAGAIVGLNPKTIEREIGRGNLRAFRLVNRSRIRREDLEAWISSNVVEPSVHDI